MKPVELGFEVGEPTVHFGDVAIDVYESVDVADILGSIAHRSCPAVTTCCILQRALMTGDAACGSNDDSAAGRYRSTHTSGRAGRRLPASFATAPGSRMCGRATTDGDRSQRRRDAEHAAAGAHGGGAQTALTPHIRAGLGSDAGDIIDTR